MSLTIEACALHATNPQVHVSQPSGSQMHPTCANASTFKWARAKGATGHLCSLISHQQILVSKTKIVTYRNVIVTYMCSRRKRKQSYTCCYRGYELVEKAMTV
jgi:hypothetical protein